MAIGISFLDILGAEFVSVKGFDAVAARLSKSEPYV
jgi:hypothetical protein